ncbi:MAG: VOC family protein [Chloroflexota bacterium]|nr:VOC family protein [Chloroflexota bacterium]
MIERFYGFNIAVKDLDEAVKKYSAVFGVEPRYFEEKDFAFPGLKGAQLMIGDVGINILESMTPDTSIAKFVENKGEGVFLVSVLVDDAEKTMEELAPKGVKFVSEKPLPSNLGKVAFGHPKSMNGVQWEFLQMDK